MGFRRVRNNLLPVAGGLELVLEVTAEVCVELFLRNKLRKVRVEPHLQLRGESPMYIGSREYADFVPCYRVQERRDTLEEKVQKKWKVDNKASAKGLDVVVLQDIQHLFRATSERGERKKLRLECNSCTDFASNGNRRASPESGTLIIYNDRHRLLTWWHEVLRPFPADEML